MANHNSTETKVTKKPKLEIDLDSEIAKGIKQRFIDADLTEASKLIQGIRRFYELSDRYSICFKDFTVFTMDEMNLISEYLDRNLVISFGSKYTKPSISVRYVNKD